MYLPLNCSVPAVHKNAAETAGRPREKMKKNTRKQAETLSFSLQMNGVEGEWRMRIAPER
jgi:hypothetical protein